MTTAKDDKPERRGPIRQYQLWAAVVVVVVLAGGAVLWWRVEGGRGIYTNGLSPARPSPLQLAAMAGWFQGHEPAYFMGSSARFGCAVYPMATRPLAGGGSMAYTQVLCGQCPPIETGGLTPVVFRLDGTAVESVEAADAPGDPMFFDEIKKYFPRQLWNAAGEQEIPQTDLDLLEATVDQVAGCNK